MANESYWTYQAGHVPTVAELPAGCFKGDQSEWQKLSPGMRREILRSFQKKTAQ